ncbi:TraM recognition domain-containing protein [Bdellovibrionota bacterium FG-2]
MSRASSVSESKGPKDNVPWEIGVGVLLFALASLGYFERNALAAFYRRNYMELWIGGYGLFATGSGFALYAVKKHTKPLFMRAKKLALLEDCRAGVYVGETLDGVKLYLPDGFREAQVEILGATGRGKTESVILSWLIQDARRRRSVILMDGKGDGALVNQIKGHLEGEGPSCRGLVKTLVFNLGDLRNSCSINPLEHGTSQQITDRIFTTFEFKEPYYEAVQYEIVGLVVLLIQEVDPPAPGSEESASGVVTFSRIYELLTNEALLKAAVKKSRQRSLQNRLNIFFKESNEKRDQDLKGVLSQMAAFAIGEIAPIVNGPVKGRDYLSLASLVLNSQESQDQTVALLSISTTLYQKLGSQLGKLLMQELGWAVGERAARGTQHQFLPVYIDEFASFVYPGFAGVLNKARSSRVAFHLSHQSIGDLAAVTDAFRDSIISGTNVKCILGLNDPNSAEVMAKHMGTQSAPKSTERHQTDLFGATSATGELSMREVEEYKVHPNRLKNYSKGQGVLHVSTKLGNVTEEVQFERLPEAR